MLNRPEYKRLVKQVRKDLDEQMADQPFVAISQGMYSLQFRGKDRVGFKESWPKVMKELGLIDDGTGTDTWTKRGLSILDNPVKLGYGDAYPGFRWK